MKPAFPEALQFFHSELKGNDHQVYLLRVCQQSHELQVTKRKGIMKLDHHDPTVVCRIFKFFRFLMMLQLPQIQTLGKLSEISIKILGIANCSFSGSWDPNKDIHVGNPSSSCLHCKLFLTHTNNSHGRTAVTREWWHRQEPPQTNLTGQNIPAEKEGTVKTSRADSSTHRIRYANSRKQGPHLSNLHSKQRKCSLGALSAVM